MCYCNPNIRKPFCEKCTQTMFSDLRKKESKIVELEATIVDLRSVVSRYIDKDGNRTPAAKWRESGEPDPHAGQYDGERASLALGSFTDDELANALFMFYDVRPPVSQILSGEAKMPIVYVTAAKERIRWLSRKLEEATSKAEIGQGAYSVNGRKLSLG